MQQVLFHIPLHLINQSLPDIPIYGYGAMLFVAFVFCTWLACRLAVQEGIAPARVQDLAIWLFVCGIAGARITFMIQYGVPLWDFFRIWDGGLVFYGSAIGGVVGYLCAHYFVLRKYDISGWKMADIVAPCAALGLAIGRVGCLLNGCCFGNVACPDCPAISFPLPTQPRQEMVYRGYQTAAGFTLDGDTNYVGLVEPGSPAADAGLQSGDRITKVDGKDVARANDLDTYFREWPRGKNDILLTVRRPDGNEEQLPSFLPWTIGLHPTQLYETISMILLFGLLMAYYPLRRHDGSVMVLWMLGYAIHRFINEMLRDDTLAVAFGMTLSQNVSVLVLVGVLILGVIVWRRPPRPAYATG